MPSPAQRYRIATLLAALLLLVVAQSARAAPAREEPVRVETGAEELGPAVAAEPSSLEDGEVEREGRVEGWTMAVTLLVALAVLLWLLNGILAAREPM